MKGEAGDISLKNRNILHTYVEYEKIPNPTRIQ